VDIANREELPVQNPAFTATGFLSNYQGGTNARMSWEMMTVSTTNDDSQYNK
jgi:hypothetical protein